MNKSILMGRLVRDPEIRYMETENGELAVASFRLAVDRKFVRKDGVKSDFFSCSAFGRLAEFAENYLLQGIKVVVTGRFENDNYQNRDGEKVYSVRLMAEEIEFAESKKASEDQADGEENSGSRASNRNAGRQNAGNSGGSSRRGGNDGSRGGTSRRSRQEDDDQDDYQEEDEDDRRDARSSGRRASGGRNAGNRNPDDRSSGGRSSGSRASGSRNTGSRGSTNSGSGRRNSVDDDYMTAPEEELDFD